MSIAAPETTETMKALGPRLFVEKDAMGNVWSGTEYFMVRRPKTLREPEPGKALALAGQEVSLERETHASGHPLLVQLGCWCRVYKRPDGQRVTVRDDFMRAVDDLLHADAGTAVHYEVKQGSNPLGPVTWVDADGQIVALVMPIRIDRTDYSDA